MEAIVYGGTGGALHIESGFLTIEGSAFVDNGAGQGDLVCGSGANQVRCGQGAGDHMFSQYMKLAKITNTIFDPFTDGSGTSVQLAGVLAGCAQHPCPLGYGCRYVAYSLSCSPCLETEVGLEYENTGGSIECSTCPPGTGPVESKSCEPCPAFEYSAFGVCQPCAPPNAVANARTACVPPFACAPGSSCVVNGVFDAGGCGSQDDCTQCPVGFASIGTEACEECNTETDQNKVASADQSTCIACGGGTQPNAEHSGCEPCPDAMFSAFGICMPCLLPSLVGNQGTSCTPPFACPAGSSCVIDGEFEPSGCSSTDECTACPVGRASVGTAPCRECNTVSEPGRVANPDQSACESCSAAKQPAADKSACLDCVSPEFSTFGITCALCAPGFTSHDGVSCVDVDECAVADGGCDPIATCDNGRSEEIRGGVVLCQDACMNSAGSYRCGPCPAGFNTTEYRDDGGRLVGSKCQLPPPPPPGSTEAAVQPEMTLQLGASADALEPGSEAQQNLLDALADDLAAVLDLDPDDIVIDPESLALSNSTAGRRALAENTGVAQRRLQEGAVELAVDFIIEAEDVNPQKSLTDLESALEDETSPLMSNEDYQPAEDQSLQFNFVCPKGKVPGGTSGGCQTCAQIPKPQYTPDDVNCYPCPANMQVNHVGDGCVCASGFYDASRGPLFCYTPGQSFDATDMAISYPTSNRRTADFRAFRLRDSGSWTFEDGADSFCRPCDASLLDCVACDSGIGGVPELLPDTALGEEAKAAAASMPRWPASRGLAGPLPIFRCVDDGCLGQTSNSTAVNSTGAPRLIGWWEDPDWVASPCSTGYGGPLCSVCDSANGYIKDGASCTPCAPVQRNGTYPVGLIIIMVLLVVILKAVQRFKSKRDEEEEDDEADATPAGEVSQLDSKQNKPRAHDEAKRQMKEDQKLKDKLEGKFNGFMTQTKIIIGATQITSELPTTLELRYPAAFAQLLVACKVFMIDIFAIFKVDCIQPISIHNKFVVTMLLPPICFAVVLLLWCVSNARVRRQGLSDAKQQQLCAKNGMTAAYRASFVLVLLYPLLSRTTFRMFSCQQLSETEAWHPDDMTVACEDPAHVNYVLAAVFCSVLYPLGVPVVFLVLLRRDEHRRQQARRAIELMTGKKIDPDVHTIDQSAYDFLREDYRPEFCEIPALVSHRCLTMLSHTDLPRVSCRRLLRGCDTRREADAGWPAGLH